MELDREALLAGHDDYTIPKFSRAEYKLLARLNRLYPYNVGWDGKFLDMCARTVSGYIHREYGVDAGTQRSSWFWVYFFGPVALAFPWSDAKEDDGRTRPHRWITIYTNGHAKAGNTERILTVFIRRLTFELVTQKLLPIEAISSNN